MHQWSDSHIKQMLKSVLTLNTQALNTPFFARRWNCVDCSGDDPWLCTCKPLQHFTHSLLREYQIREKRHDFYTKCFVSRKWQNRKGSIIKLLKKFFHKRSMSSMCSTAWSACIDTAPGSQQVKSPQKDLQMSGINFTCRKHEISNFNVVWVFCANFIRTHVTATKHMRDFSFGDSQSVLQFDWNQVLTKWNNNLAVYIILKDFRKIWILFATCSALSCLLIHFPYEHFYWF